MYNDLKNMWIGRILSNESLIKNILIHYISTDKIIINLELITS